MVEITIIQDFLSAEECDEWVREAEAAPDDGETVKIGGLYNTIEDPDKAAILFSRLCSHLSIRSLPDWRPVGVNENFRILKYLPEEEFPVHQDPSYSRPHGHEDHGDVSFTTLIIYLNAGFTGGETVFHPFGEGTPAAPVRTIVPRKGMAVVFPHTLHHASTPIVTGIKYTLRTDVMFRPL